MELLDTVIAMLAQGEVLPPCYKDYALMGNWKGHRKYHMQPDWLLIYRLEHIAIHLIYKPHMRPMWLYFCRRNVSFVSGDKSLS